MTLSQTSFQLVIATPHLHELVPDCERASVSQVKQMKFGTSGHPGPAGRDPGLIMCGVQDIRLVRWRSPERCGSANRTQQALQTGDTGRPVACLDSAGIRHGD